MIASVKIDQPWCERAPPKFSTSVSVKWANIRRKSAIKREKKHPTLFQSKAKKNYNFGNIFLPLLSPLLVLNDYNSNPDTAANEQF